MSVLRFYLNNCYVPIRLSVGTLMLLVLGNVAVIASPPRSPQEQARSLVEALGSDSYHTRIRARRKLEQWGPTRDVCDALGAGLDSDLLETRQMCQLLLDEFEIAAFDQQLDRLLNLHVDPAEITLPGWSQFCRVVGTDRWSRRMFSQIAKRHRRIFQQMDRDGDESSLLTVLVKQIDPYRLTSDNVVDWSLLLFVDAINIDVARIDASGRILQALRNSGLGPKPNSSSEQELLKRLVSRWLIQHPNVGGARDQMLVAMRYQCHTHARKLILETLDDESSPASFQTTAMLCASVLAPELLSEKLLVRLDDDRTAHVWQLIASRKTKVRTQVRDVALAILLHQSNIDPRSVGFAELQADPLVLFRDHSLGFADDNAREQAHGKGKAVLGITPSP